MCPVYGINSLCDILFLLYRTTDYHQKKVFSQMEAHSKHN
jgi:hypothetical protein